MNRILVSSFLLFTGISFAYDWVGGEAKYQFAPGFCMSEKHAAFYCKEYHASTGEVIRSDSSMEVLQPSCVAINFSEIDLAYTDKKKDRRKAEGFIDHLFSRIGHLASAIHDRIRGTSVDGQSSTEYTVSHYWVKGGDVDLAQEKDIALLSGCYDTLVQKNVVLYGVSRGAATSFIFMGRDYWGKANKKIKLVILEGCFDSLNHAFFHYPFFKRVIYSSLGRAYIPGFKTQEQRQLEPINFVTHFPQDIPILFVTSKKDTTVPPMCTKNLAYQLKRAGHHKVYLLELQNSRHIGYFCHDATDVQNYLTVVHTLYKLYGLPYISEYAQGEALLEQCRL